MELAVLSESDGLFVEKPLVVSACVLEFLCEVKRGLQFALSRPNM